MNKEQQIEEIILTVKKAIADNAEIYDEDYISADSNDIDHAAEQIAETLYNLGYRKSKCKAEIERLEAEKETMITDRVAFGKAYDKLRAENAYLKKALSNAAKINEAGEKELVKVGKQAVNAFAEKLKERITDENGTQISTLTVKGIELVLKEFLSNE